MAPSDAPSRDGDESTPPSSACPSPGFRPERFTLPLLLLALSTLFLCSVDKGYFYGPDEHNGNMGITLAIAENLSLEHRFRLFPRRRQGSDGAPAYDMYSRFPVGGYALIKLAIFPFGNDLSAKILAARMLMLLLFSAAAVLAFHALARITSRPWVAVAATLAAFSSYYMLFYNDVAVQTEASVDLFAVMLAFHGMVVFVQEGRFPQLLAKTGVALLLGWHVYAFLLPFILLGLAGEAIRAWRDGTAVWPRVCSSGAAVLRSRYAALGLAALLFGMAVLSFNFANEYTAFRGETPVSELPSFRSMLRRTGLDPEVEASFDPGWWLRFLRQQFHRVRVASVPLVVSDWGAGLRGLFPSVPFSETGLSWPELSVYVVSLLLAAVASLVVVRLARSLLVRRHRLLLATLALSGFCWALPMRHNVAQPVHAHEALYYVGVPLVSYSLLLLYVRRRWGRGPVVGLAVAALLAFVASAFQMDQRRRADPRAVEVQKAAMAELGAIRETTRGKVVMLLGSVGPEWSGHLMHQYRTWDYYLAGSLLAQPFDMGVAAADFILTHDRVESDSLLTPENELVFLYDSAGIDDLDELYRATYRHAVSGDLVARSRFDVYLGDDALTHVKAPCVREDLRWRQVFVEVVPEDPKNSHEWRLLSGFNSRIWSSVVPFEGKCIAVFPLPDDPVSRIRTGHHGHRRGSPVYDAEGWRVEIPANPAPD